MIDDERLYWVERWLRGWRDLLDEQEFDYGLLAFACAVDIGLQLAEEVKRLRE